MNKTTSDKLKDRLGRGLKLQKLQKFKQIGKIVI